MPQLVLTLDEIPTPIGGLIVAVDPEGSLCAADWSDCRDRLLRLLARYYGAAISSAEGTAPHALRQAILAYFAGDLTALDAVPVHLAGTTFQRSVWTALRGIAPGRPLSYAALAQRLGRPNAARAVGHANGANPVSVVIPCHRLVGAAGALTGYAGGLARKGWLLAHEGAAAGA